MSDYYSVNIYFFSDTYSSNLRVIRPFLTRLNSMGIDFFFLSYEDEKGPHIRLRIKTVSDVLKMELSAFLRNLDSSLQWEVSEFEPEVKRYGGDKYVQYIYDYYCESSIYLLNILDSDFEKLKYYYFVSYTIESIFNCDKGELVKVSSDLFNSWNKHLSYISKNYFNEELEWSFRRFVNSCFTGEVDFLEPLPRVSSMVPENYFKIRSKDDIVHLTANRFGISNQEEVVIYSLLSSAI